MAKPQQQPAGPQAIADGIFAGITPERAAEIEAHFEAKIAEERKSLDELLKQATESAAHAAPAPVATITPDNIVAALGQMRDGVLGQCLAVLQKEGREAGRKGDHVSVSKYGRLATVFGEFSNAIAEFIASHPN